ncbi:hypothetical protein ACFL5E_02615 [Candidatus Omnitrophota bacterium]
MKLLKKIISRCFGKASPPYEVYSMPEYLQGKSVESIGDVPWTYEEMEQDLKEFAGIYRNRPIKNNIGGMNSSHMFYCWFVARRLDPEYIIESGVWKGQSTWLFEISAPKAKIISIDPCLDKREYISQKADYRTEDFSRTDWSNLPRDRTLCFFDDHYGVDRIKQCHDFGFKHILYDDNYPTPGGNKSHPSGDAMSPKATFYAGGEEANLLRSVLKVYYEFPPVYPNITGPRFVWNEYQRLTPTPLLSEIKDNKLKFFKDEAWGYTWLCYSELM